MNETEDRYGKKNSNARIRLVNKKIEEDSRSNQYWKNFNNREEEIRKDNYGLAMKRTKETNQEEDSCDSIIQIELIEQIIDRAMEKNKEFMDKLMRSQERMWQEFDSRLTRLERKIGMYGTRKPGYDDQRREEDENNQQFRRRV